MTPNAPIPPYGQSQTFTVGVATQVAPTVPPAPVSFPTGTVTITTPGVLQPLCTATLTNGAGTCTTTLPVPTGSGIVYQASYAGDSNFLASIGPELGQHGDAHPASVTLNTTQATTAFGSETGQVFSSTVASTTTGTPTGTVTYTAGGVTLCTVTTRPAGAATLLADQRHRTRPGRPDHHRHLLG